MTLFPPELVDLARATIDQLKAAGRRVTTAESCTGGLIAGALTEIAGSSDVVGRGFVTYSNAAKSEVLGVQAGTLEAHGAVSHETVREMAEGALRAAGKDADAAIAVSGVAGPGGGSPAKPVGTVFIAVALEGRPAASRHHLFPGDRTEVRLRTVTAALAMLREELAR